MFDAFSNLLGKKNQKKNSPAAAVQTRTRPRPEARDHRQTFTKVFRWHVPVEQDPKPGSVEVVGSFNGWQRLAMDYDRPTKTWQVTLRNIVGNRTHHYVMLVDGKPTYDKTCDGLAVPQGPHEERYQIDTAKGPRVMLLFAQTK